MNRYMNSSHSIQSQLVTWPVFVILSVDQGEQLSFGGISLARWGPMVEKWSLQALENSLELEIMEPFSFNSFTVVLLVRREVTS